MPERMKGGGYDELITPINEEGNRTKNDPDTKNVPSDATDPPDPLGLMHGNKSGGRRGGPPPKG